MRERKLPRRVQEKIDRGGFSHPDIDAANYPVSTQDINPEPHTGLEKTPGTKTFGTKFISQQIKTLLESQEKIQEIKSLNVVGSGGEIRLDTFVKAKDIITATVGIQAVLENKNGSLAVKSYEIDAPIYAKGTVEKIIAPKLGEVSELLKSYVEKQEGRKVAKIEIENGELKVTFAKQTTVPVAKKEAPVLEATQAIPKDQVAPITAETIATLKKTIEHTQETLEKIKEERAAYKKLMEDMRRELETLEKEEGTTESEAQQVAVQTHKEISNADKTKVEQSKDSTGSFTKEEKDKEADPIYEEAKALVLEFGIASTLLLQGRLRIRYSRAANLIEMMEERGVIGPTDGIKPREILEKVTQAKNPTKSLGKEQKITEIGRKWKAEIDSMEEIKKEKSYLTRKIESAIGIEKKYAAEYLEMLNNSPLEFYTKRLGHATITFSQQWAKEEVEKIQKTIDEINTINTRYSNMLENLEKES